jgi:hypothetical protein
MTKFAVAKALVIVIGAALAMWPVLTKTASNLYWSRQPALALRFDGANNFALSKLANAALLNQQQPGALDVDAGSRFALRALRAAPRDSNSLAVLAFAADAGKIKTAGLPLAEKAQAYSKRTLLAQIYFIERNARKGRVGDALAYYDLALTTHPSSQSLLLPRLYGALVAPQVRTELIKILARDPAWKKDFWLGLTNLRPVPDTALQLLAEVGPRRSALVPGIAPRLVWALARSGRFGDAARAAELGQSERSIVRAARPLDDFVKDQPSPPVDWQYDSGGSFNAVPGKSELLLSVRGSQDVVFARRLLFLPAGRPFALGGTMVSHFGQGSLVISVRCAGTDRTLAAKELKIARQGSAAFTTGRFVVSQDCAEQWLAVSGESSGMGRMEVGLRGLALTEGAQ